MKMAIFGLLLLLNTGTAQATTQATTLVQLLASIQADISVIPQLKTSYDNAKSAANKQNYLDNLRVRCDRLEVNLPQYETRNNKDVLTSEGAIPGRCVTLDGQYKVLQGELAIIVADYDQLWVDKESNDAALEWIRQLAVKNALDSATNQSYVINTKNSLTNQRRAPAGSLAVANNRRAQLKNAMPGALNACLTAMGVVGVATMRDVQVCGNSTSPGVYKNYFAELKTLEDPLPATSIPKLKIAVKTFDLKLALVNSLIGVTGANAKAKTDAYKRLRVDEAVALPGRINAKKAARDTKYGLMTDKGNELIALDRTATVNPNGGACEVRPTLTFPESQPEVCKGPPVKP